LKLIGAAGLDLAAIPIGDNNMSRTDMRGSCWPPETAKTARILQYRGRSHASWSIIAQDAHARC
jgi:hypothetical protein